MEENQCRAFYTSIVIGKRYMSEGKFDLAVECLIVESRTGCADSTQLLEQCAKENKGKYICL